MFAIIIVYFVLFSIFLLIQNCKRPPRYPPGPAFLPIIGSWYTFPAIGAVKKVSAWRKKYGNIIGHKFGFKYVVVVTGAEEVVNGLKHPNFQNRVNSEFLQSRTMKKKLGFFNTNSEQLVEVRRFTLRYLSLVFNKRLEEIMQQQMAILFNQNQSEKTILVDEKFLNFFLHSSLEILVSVKNGEFPHEIDMLQDLVKQSFQKGRISGIETLYGWFGRFFNYDLHGRVTSYVLQFLANRLEEHRKTFDPNIIRDYMDAFLLEQMKEKKSLETQYYSDEELLVCLSDLIQTSSESTGNAAAFLLLHVSLNPNSQKKIHEELDTVLGTNKPTFTDKYRLPYCEAVVKEIFRIHPLVSLGLAHSVSDDTEFYGYDLKKNTVLYFAHEDNFKNPELWMEPEKFRPERFINGETNSQLTNFGIGKRSCVAQFFVRNALSLFVAHFFQHYSIRFPPGEKTPNWFTMNFEGFTNGCKPFYLVLTERQRL